LPMPRRLGVFGGTFDPPHVGHLILASESLAQLGLHKVLWVLTATPPHKQPNAISALEERLAMLRLAIGDNPAFEISDMDMRRSGPHYTYDTMRLLEREYPDAELVLILGGDSLHDLPSWHRPAELVAACHEIGIMRRPADSIDLAQLEQELPGLTKKARLVDAPLLEIASHEIRSRARRSLPFRYFVPPAVYDYIVQHRLYSDA
jgi:nicotinate-nucleotide adenylyltransferase